MKMVNSTWKGRIGIPDVRKDRSCHFLSRLTRTKGSDRRSGETGLSDLKSENLIVMASGVNDPSGMRPEAQLSDPMNWDTFFTSYYLLGLGS